MGAQVENLGHQIKEMVGSVHPTQKAGRRQPTGWKPVPLSPLRLIALG